MPLNADTVVVIGAVLFAVLVGIVGPRKAVVLLRALGGHSVVAMLVRSAMLTPSRSIRRSGLQQTMSSPPMVAMTRTSPAQDISHMASTN